MDTYNGIKIYRDTDRYNAFTYLTGLSDNDDTLKGLIDIFDISSESSKNLIPFANYISVYRALIDKVIPHLIMYLEYGGYQPVLLNMMSNRVRVVKEQNTMRNAVLGMVVELFSAIFEYTNDGSEQLEELQMAADKAFEALTIEDVERLNIMDTYLPAIYLYIRNLTNTKFLTDVTGLTWEQMQKEYGAELKTNEPKTVAIKLFPSRSAREVMIIANTIFRNL